jgi:purine-nucleoside phosphorylase
MRYIIMRKKIQQAVKFIQEKIPDVPDIGVILGSGLGDYADSFSNSVILSYTDIPHFPRPTVSGHKGCLVFQAFNGFMVVVMQGRFHYYEGYSMKQVTFPVRVLGMLGIRRLIVTNAAGGINPEFAAGDLMLITDHINLMGVNPLRGPHLDEYGQRFPDMTEAYNKEDLDVFETVARTLGISLKKGIYSGLSGPSYETPAEIRMLRILGSDAVGMSTVPEVIVANQMEIRVSGVSCITNMAAGISPTKLTHQEVMDTANRVKKPFISLIDGVIQAFRSQARNSKGEMNHAG